MILILDTLNIVYKIPLLEMYIKSYQIKQALAPLVNLVCQRSEAKYHKIFFCIDGKPLQLSTNNLLKYKFIYSNHKSADHYILKLVKKYFNRYKIKVITSDKKLSFYLNKYKVEIEKSEDYVASNLLINEKVEQKPNDDFELSYWVKTFRI